MSETLLQVSSACKKFGGIVANDDISLRADKGEIVGLIGPNGFGKSTLFNLICGTYPTDAGKIIFNGRDINSLTSAQIARAGLVRTFQQTRVYRGMTCINNMCISAADGNWLRPPTKKAWTRRWNYYLLSVWKQNATMSLAHFRLDNKNY